MRDVVYEMEITLEELCREGSKKVRIWSEGLGDAEGFRERVAKDIEISLRTGMHSVSTTSVIVSIVEGGGEQH